MRQAELKMPEITVYADVTADDIMKDYDGGDLKDYLVEIMAKQAMSPVYWEEIIRRFEADGVKAIIEVGPGTTAFRIDEKKRVRKSLRSTWRTWKLCRKLSRS